MYVSNQDKCQCMGLSHFVEGQLSNGEILGSKNLESALNNPIIGGHITFQPCYFVPRKLMWMIIIILLCYFWCTMTILFYIRCWSKVSRKNLGS